MFAMTCLRHVCKFGGCLLFGVFNVSNVNTHIKQPRVHQKFHTFWSIMSFNNEAKLLSEKLSRDMEKDIDKYWTCIYGTL